jgi:CBS domain-containing protein
LNKWWDVVVLKNDSDLVILKTKFPVGTCTRNTSFNFVLLRILALRVHRLWVVDDKEHPIGVISLTDIMKTLIAEKQPERRT